VEDLHQVTDPRVVRDARANQPDALAAVLGDLRHRRAQGVEAPVTDGPVDLALEAESATAPAAFADFQELHVPVFGLRRLQDGPRLEPVDVREAALDDHGGHGRVSGHHGVDAAIGGVGHAVRVGYVDTGEGLPALDDPLAAGL